jgi:hypothetical protein
VLWNLVAEQGKQYMVGSSTITDEQGAFTVSFTLDTRPNGLTFAPGVYELSARVESGGERTTARFHVIAP